MSNFSYSEQNPSGEVSTKTLLERRVFSTINDLESTSFAVAALRAGPILMRERADELDIADFDHEFPASPDEDERQRELRSRKMFDASFEHLGLAEQLEVAIQSLAPDDTAVGRVHAIHSSVHDEMLEIVQYTDPYITELTTDTRSIGFVHVNDELQTRVTVTSDTDRLGSPLSISQQPVSRRSSVVDILDPVKASLVLKETLGVGHLALAAANSLLEIEKRIQR